MGDSQRHDAFSKVLKTKDVLMRRRQGTKTSEAHGPAWVGHCEQGLENHGFTDITGYRDLRSQGVATG